MKILYREKEGFFLKALQVYHGIKATILNHHVSLVLKPSLILHLLLFFISSLDIISADKSDAFLMLS